MPRLDILEATYAKIAALPAYDEYADEEQEQPDRNSWAQSSWGYTNECGTAACFAGWVYNDYVEPIARARTDSIIFKAKEILGLDGVTFSTLTHDYNILEDIRAVVEMCVLGHTHITHYEIEQYLRKDTDA
jgi:hypothetical protein